MKKSALPRQLPLIVSIGCLLIAVPASSLSSFAAEPDDGKASIDPKVKTVIQQMAEFYQGLRSCSVEMSRHMHVEMQGMKSERMD